MMTFVLGAACLLLLAAAFVAWPLLRLRVDADAADRRAINVALYRQRVDEIDSDASAGLLPAADAAVLTQELAGTLLDDDAIAAPGAAAAGGRSVAAALVLALVVVVGCLGLYKMLGAYDAVVLADAATVLRGPDAPPAALADLVKRLRLRVATQPDDAESWYLLGHALLRADDAAGAVTAFEQLVAIAPDDPGAQVALAQSRFVAAGGVVTAVNRQLIERILAADPQQSIVLEMLALEAFRNADYKTAAQHLENALAGGASGARAESLQLGLARARELLGNVGPALDVTIQMAKANHNLPAGAALFVYARKPGERMPLLVARRAPQGDVMTVHLDQTNAMRGDVTLSAGDVLEVGARVSTTGSITPGAQDLQASQPAVRLTEGVVAVTLSLGAAGAPTAVVGSTASSLVAAAPVPAAAPAAVARGILVDVALAPGVTAQPPARIFIIARAPSGPPMPIVVRALDPATLPQSLRLTDRDAMQPSRLLSMFEQVEVLARLSRTGNPLRQPGDLESTSQRVDPRAAAAVALTIGAP